MFRCNYLWDHRTIRWVDIRSSTLAVVSTRNAPMLYSDVHKPSTVPSGGLIFSLCICILLCKKCSGAIQCRSPDYPVRSLAFFTLLEMLRWVQHTEHRTIQWGYLLLCIILRWVQTPLHRTIRWGQLYWDLSNSIKLYPDCGGFLMYCINETYYHIFLTNMLLPMTMLSLITKITIIA